MLHLGTLVAVLIYFRKEILAIAGMEISEKVRVDKDVKTALKIEIQKCK